VSIIPINRWDRGDEEPEVDECKDNILPLPHMIQGMATENINKSFLSRTIRKCSRVQYGKEDYACTGCGW